MSDIDRPLTDAEKEELERRRREGRPSLDEELVRKYDPERLRRMVVADAGRGEQLDLTTRSDLERRLPGHDFGRVRVFRGPLAEEITQRHNADAVTIANTGMVLLRDTARSAPGTTSGQALLAHEMTHVAQAQKGMVFAKEGGQEGAHEKEAEAVEAEASGKGGKKGDGGKKAAEAKRTRVVERVMELLQEERLAELERRGLF